MRLQLRFGSYVLSGILTIIPIWVSWAIFDFIWRQLSQVGLPWLRLLANGLRADPTTTVVADILTTPWVEKALAAVLTIVVLYLIGWGATRVIGARLIALFDRLILRVPLIGYVYGAVHKLVTLLREKPEGAQRVVVIDFPHPQLKAIGLLMRTMTDVNTGARIATVYVPTAPNPTSGYLELVPVERLVTTDWTVDEAMNFIMTMGAVAPDTVQFNADSDKT
ncbi:MAG: DUF502 domain-containing protein [Rhodospirillales bacterium]